MPVIFGNFVLNQYIFTKIFFSNKNWPPYQYRICYFLNRKNFLMKLTQNKEIYITVSGICMNDKSLEPFLVF